VRAADDPVWRVREAQAYWRVIRSLRIALLAFLIIGVSVLALLLGGPVAVFRTAIEFMFVVVFAAIISHSVSVPPMYRHIHRIPELAAMDPFERGPKLFGLVARDLFDLRSWRPPR
jgi:hypothetical protein